MTLPHSFRMQPMSRRIHPLALLLSASLVAACGGGDGPSGPDGGNADKPFESPRGAAFVLPSNLSIQGTLEGTSPYLPPDEDSPCHPSNAGQAGFSYDFVNVCLTLRNTRATDDTLDLPTGLVFVAQDEEVQNGVVVQPIAIRVPAGRDTTVIVRLWCGNEHRGASVPGVRYSLGPVTNVAGITEIASLLEGKRIDEDAVAVIQGAVWEVSDNGGLTDESRADLRALPDATVAFRR